MSPGWLKGGTLHACTSLRQDTESVKISLDLRALRRDMPNCAVQGLQNPIGKATPERVRRVNNSVSEGDSVDMDFFNVLRTGNAREQYRA